MRTLIRDKLEDRGYDPLKLIKRLEERKEILYIRRLKYNERTNKLSVGNPAPLSDLTNR